MRPVASWTQCSGVTAGVELNGVKYEMKCGQDHGLKEELYQPATLLWRTHHLSNSGTGHCGNLWDPPCRTDALLSASRTSTQIHVKFG